VKKDEFIKRRGEEAWENHLIQSRAWKLAHREEIRISNRVYNQVHAEQHNALAKKWQEDHPEKVAARMHEVHRKGGRYYENELEYARTGVQGERNTIRGGHRRTYRPYKKIIAPGSQLHHQWRAGTAGYDGVALVETNQHQHGIIDVIQILEGNITLLTEKAIRNAG
jgi:hypothetical protein